MGTLGYIIYGDGPRRPALGERKILGCPFLTLRMGVSRHPGEAFAKRRAAEAAGQLTAAGVRRAVFPVDFPYLPLFARRGIFPVDTLPLRRALAAPLTQRRLAALEIPPGKAVVAVSADGMSRRVEEAVRPLAIGARYALLDVPSGGEALARSLRREYGISLRLRPSREQLEMADALLLFSPREDLTLGNRIFYALYADSAEGRLTLALPPAAEQEESNCGREQLAAALWGAGALSLTTLLSEIPVDRIPKSSYNASTII